MENEMIIVRLCESVDPDVIYGALRVPHHKIKEIQTAIYNIKERFYDEKDKWYNEEWDVCDLIERLKEQFPEIEVVDFETYDYLVC